MFRFLRRHNTLVMTAMAVCIALLILFGIGGTSFMTSPFDTVFKINGQSISQAEFDQIYNQVARTHPENGAASGSRQQIMSQALNELIRQEVFFQESKRFGIQVSDQQLQMQLASYPAFQKDGKFDFPTYARTVAQAMDMAPRDFEKNQKKDIAGHELNELVADSVHISDEDLQQEIANRLATEKDAAKRKEITSDPEKIRNEMRDKELNLVFGDWLTQLNASLKVNIVSDTFRQRMGAAAPQK
jgi:peptidyl-prolyl cis-trans isomerase D